MFSIHIDPFCARCGKPNPPSASVRGVHRHTRCICFDPPQQPTPQRARRPLSVLPSNLYPRQERQSLTTQQLTLDPSFRAQCFKCGKPLTPSKGRSQCPCTTKRPRGGTALAADPDIITRLSVTSQTPENSPAVSRVPDIDDIIPEVYPFNEYISTHGSPLRPISLSPPPPQRRPQRRTRLPQRFQDSITIHDEDYDGSQRPLRRRRRHQPAETLPQPETPQPQYSRPVTAAVSIFNSLTVVPHTVGDFYNKRYQCQRCGAFHFKEEALSKARPGEEFTFTKCCREGRMRFEPAKAPPELQQLFQGTHPLSKSFRKDIRKFNAAWAFSSVNISGNKEDDHPKAMFHARGQIFHLYGDPRAPRVKPNFYATTVFYSSEDTAKKLQERNPETDLEIHLILGRLRELNPLTRNFHRALEYFGGISTPALSDRVTLPSGINTTITLIRGRKSNREELPTTDEVAAIIPTDDDDVTLPRKSDIILMYRDPTGRDKLQRISHLHHLYYTTTYPLLFPDGSSTWSPDLRSVGGEKIGRIHWWSGFFHRRPGFWIWPQAERLLQQLLVDVWGSCEQDRLDWLWYNQKAIRADKYSRIQTHARGPNHGTSDLGIQRIILPSTHVGSRRFMVELYRDACAIAKRFGKPTFFVTFTANPHWPEFEAIVDRDRNERDNPTAPGSSANNYPDLVVRIFHLKLKGLLEDLTGRPHSDSIGIFGPTRAHVYTVEYQKRGLPHAHIILWLDPTRATIPTNPESVNELIKAELPSPDTDPTGELTDLVRSLMFHGPCGPSTKQPCMTSSERLEAGQLPRCTKNFPRQIQEVTVLPGDGYPCYRRQEHTLTLLRHEGGLRVIDSNGDNQWVVAYNPFLLLKYRSHMNVEICHNFRIMQYLFKYINKGSSKVKALLKGHDSDNEIKVYLTGRYLCPSEAIMRLFEFPTHACYPPVERLGVHLEGEHDVTINDDEDLESLLERGAEVATKQLAFFRYNRENPAAQLLYSEMPEHCTWIPKERRWALRKRNTNKIGRIHSPPPQANPELFYQRILFDHRRGPTGFADLRTINGVVYPTNQKACEALGLTENSQIWRDTLADAISCQLPDKVRHLFACLLHWSGIADPANLWEEFRDFMCQDLRRQIEQGKVRIPMDAPVEDPNFVPAYDYTLWSIRQELSKMGWTDPYDPANKEIPEDLDQNHAALPTPMVDWTRQIDVVADEIAAWDPLSQGERYGESHARLNAGQRAAFDFITQQPPDSPQPCFVNGAAGTGKTFLYETLCQYYRGEQEIVITVASSGIAAQLLPGGTTAHSRFAIPIAMDPNKPCALSKASRNAKLIRAASLIIWDELPMMHKGSINKVNKLLNFLMDVPEDDQSIIFGGKRIVFGGDFAQTLPVVEKGGPGAALDASFRRSHLWERFRVLHLTENMRLANDPENRRYADWLQQDVSGYNLEYQDRRIQLPESVNQLSDVSEAVRFVYSDPRLDCITPVEGKRSHEPDEDYRQLLAGRAILALMNTRVREINRAISDTFVEHSIQTRTYAAKYDRGYGSFYSEDYMKHVNISGFPDDQLTLAEGMPIMVLRNLAPQYGVVNGTRMVIKTLLPNIIIGIILTGSKKGQEFPIPRIKLEIGEDHGHIEPFYRGQFPVMVSYAMTVHKSQGQSLARVGIELTGDVFSHGQLYVALSRVTDVKQMVVVTPRRGVFNIVEPAVLLPLEEQG